MKILLLILVAWLPLAGCDTIPGVQWPDVVHCGSRAADDLFPEVSTILLDDVGETMSPMAKRSLEDLALDHGADVVACLVDRLVQRWSAPGAVVTPRRSEAVARALAWQHETGTVVHHPEPAIPTR